MSQTRTVAARHLTKLCLKCGYRGGELQLPSARILRCPRCREDLYTRPPRSYAELEGIDEANPPTRGASGGGTTTTTRSAIAVEHARTAVTISPPLPRLLAPLHRLGRSIRRAALRFLSLLGLRRPR